MKIRAYFMEVNENEVVYAGYTDFIENDVEQIREYLRNPIKIVDNVDEKENDSADVQAGQGNGIEMFRLTEELVLYRSTQKELPVNRAIVRKGEIVEILHGNLICVREQKGVLASVNEQDIDVIKQCVKPIFPLYETYTKKVSLSVSVAGRFGSGV